MLDKAVYIMQNGITMKVFDRDYTKARIIRCTKDITDIDNIHKFDSSERPQNKKQAESNVVRMTLPGKTKAGGGLLKTGDHKGSYLDSLDQGKD